jgi:hypothetical protein
MGLVLGIEAYRKSPPSAAVDDPGSWGTPISDGSLAIQLSVPDRCRFGATGRGEVTLEGQHNILRMAQLKG